MQKSLTFIFVLLLASPVFASRYSFRPILRYNMCPCVNYDATPVKMVVKEAAKVTKKAVKSPIKAVKSLPARTYNVRRS